MVSTHWLRILLIIAVGWWVYSFVVPAVYGCFYPGTRVLMDISLSAGEELPPYLTTTGFQCVGYLVVDDFIALLGPGQCLFGLMLLVWLFTRNDSMRNGES